MGDIESWSDLYRMRQAVKAQYPSIWKIPLVKKEADRLLRNIKDGCRVLEVGAGDRRFEAKVTGCGRGITYRSMDIDRKTRQDYYSIEEISGTFDLIFLFELIEHLTPADGLNLLSTLRGLLEEKGVLLLGTPNLYHPHRYFGDITHKTPYKYEELGALMLLAGFKHVRFFRMYNESFFKRLFRLHAGIFLHRYLDIDFAGTILAEGTV